MSKVKDTKSKTYDPTTFKPSELAEAIELFVFLNIKNATEGKSRRGLMIWGPPGIGKSAIAKQVAKKLGMHFIDIRLTQMEPTDLRGIPVPFTDTDGKSRVVWAVPSFLPHDPDDSAIIFMDEIANAPPSVQASCYQLVLDGSLGEYGLPVKSVVMAASNRETDRGSTFKMPLPLQNRFAHVEQTHDFKEWRTYGLNNDMHPTTIGYLSAFENHLFEFDPSSASRGFPTPRSWEAVSDVMNCDVDVREKVIDGIIIGLIGEGIGIQFNNFRKRAIKLPSPHDILDGRITTLPSDQRDDVSMMYALTTALCYEIRKRYLPVAHLPKDAQEKRDITLYMDNFLGFMMNNFKDEMTIMGARQALSVYRITFLTTGMKNWKKFSENYAELILKA